MFFSRFGFIGGRSSKMGVTPLSNEGNSVENGQVQGPSQPKILILNITRNFLTNEFQN